MIIDKGMNRGDVYVVLMTDGRYGAIRVLRFGNDSYLIYVSTYLDGAPPDLGDPRLRTILVQNRFHYEQVPAVKWETGKFPLSFIHLGTLELTPEEEALNSNTHGTISGSTGLEALWEWRYLNDREALTKEFDQQHEQLLARVRKRRHKPKTMLEDELFWDLISLLDPDGESEEAIIGACVERLVELPVAQIQRFEETLAFILYKLDTREHARHIGLGAFQEEVGHFSADNFLYARCAAVASGKRTYDRALKDPARMPQNTEMEVVLGIAAAAYVIRSGRTMNYVTGCSYETFSNRSGWK